MPPCPPCDTGHGWPAAFASTRLTGSIEAISSPTTKISGARQCREVARCLLGYGPFRGGSELAKHYRRIHARNGTFDSPFLCPECLRQGLGDVSIEGVAPAWSNHTETVHGKAHAPNLPSYTTPVEDSVQCLLCQGFFKEGAAFRDMYHERMFGRKACVSSPFYALKAAAAKEKKTARMTEAMYSVNMWHQSTARPSPLYGPSHRLRSLDSSFINRSREDFDKEKRKRADDDVGASFEVGNDTDVSNDPSDDTRMPSVLLTCESRVRISSCLDQWRSSR